MFHTIDPRYDNLTLLAEHCSLDKDRGFWRVEGYDAAGNCQVSVLWDASTGKLNGLFRGYIGRRVMPVSRNRRQAAYAARHWLGVLEGVGEPSDWHLVDQEIHIISYNNGYWVTRWERSGERARVCVNAVGDLIVA